MAEKKPENVADIPDPDEDDLDDLDDVLDEFAATKIDTNLTTPGASGPGRPPPTPANTDEDEFSKALQAGMADLLGGLEKDPEMQKEFEALVKELGEAAANSTDEAETPTIEADKAKAGPSKPAETSFQDTIRRTMERIQESGDQAGAAATATDPDDILGQMLKEMEKGGFNAEGSDEDFSKMLMGMMEQLTNKDILYEPMKELHDKFPAWLDKNRGKVDKADLVRYEEQKALVAEIVGKFEEKSYSDSNPSHREYIVERMQKMQAAGSPPPDLVGDMNAAQEALGEIDAGCPTQ